MHIATFGIFASALVSIGSSASDSQGSVRAIRCLETKFAAQRNFDPPFDQWVRVYSTVRTKDRRLLKGVIYFPSPSTGVMFGSMRNKNLYAILKPGIYTIPDRDMPRSFPVMEGISDLRGGLYRVIFEPETCEIVSEDG